MSSEGTAMTSAYPAVVFAALMVLSLPAGGVQFSDTNGTGVADMDVDEGTVTIDFETVYGEHGTTDGMLLTDEYNATHGITFDDHFGDKPAGAQIINCSDEGVCEEARSGETVIRGTPGELQNNRVEVQFAELKRSVTVYVRESERAADEMDQGDRMVVHMNASDLWGMDETNSTSFAPDSGWHKISLGDPDEDPMIQGFELSGHVEGEHESNFIIMDDLTFDLEDGPRPPPEDEVAPAAILRSPSDGESLDEEFLPLEVSARDDRRLANVSYELGFQGEAPFRERQICGDRFFPCPPSDDVFSYENDVRLPGEGDYVIDLEACDLTGNCSRTSASFAVLKPDEPEIHTPVVAEISQGVQSELVELPSGTGAVEDYGRLRTPLVANKTTVVRVYPFAEDGSRPDFSRRLRMRIVRDDGSETATRLWPNAGPESIEVSERPDDEESRDRELWGMRAETDESLNYVVPAELLSDADYVEFGLEGMTGVSRVEISPEVTMGIIPYNMSGPTLPPEEKDNMRGLYQHLRVSYPISDLRVPRGDRWESVDGSPSEDPFVGLELAQRDSNETADILSDVSLLDSSVAPRKSSRPDYVVAIGFAGRFNDTGGRAYLGKPLGVSVALPSGPHEIGHTLGLEHASNAHNESDGGGWEPWPYPHGRIGPEPNAPRGVYQATFGVIPNQTSDGPGPGEWELTLIDQCPTAVMAENQSKRLPTCSLADSVQMHDMMSYGANPFWTADIFPGGNRFKWPSDKNYRRLLGGIRSRSPHTTTSTRTTGSLAATEDDTRGDSAAAASTSDSDSLDASSDSDAPVEGLVIVGEVRGDDWELTAPPMRKPVAPTDVTDGTGNYTARLEDENGTTVAERAFDVAETPEAGNEGDGMFSLVLPYEPSATVLIIEDDTRRYVAREASPNAPEVTVTSPDGGEILEAGEYTTTWEADDPDGDELTFLVEYSPDGGLHWEGVTVVHPGQPNESTFEVGAFVPGRKGVVRVSASDGLNTDVDYSDEYFSLGTEEEPAPNLPPSVEAPPAVTIDEGGTAELETSFVDPDPLDSHTAEIDWGEGTVTAGAVSEHGGAGTVSGSHDYGDDGVYTVTVNVTDDHDHAGTNTTTVTVENLDPTVSIDTTDTIAFSEGDAFLGTVGESQRHEANASDPGSDDLTFEWPEERTTYFNDGIGPDPDLSPGGTFQFEVADEANVTFDDPGVHEVVVTVTDDDGGSASDTATKVVTAPGGDARGIGFWRHQYSERGRVHYSEANLTAFLTIVDFGSAVFHENVSVDSFELAHEILRTAGPSMRTKAEAQTLAAWLNFAAGRVNWDEQIDTTGDGTGDRTFHDVMSEVESILNDPGATDAELERAKDLAEAVNTGGDPTIQGRAWAVTGSG